MNSPQDQAMSFIATYEHSDADTYERHVVRIARIWLSIIKSKHSVQVIVNHLVFELYDPKTKGYGCGWDALRKQFIHWAITEKWIDQKNTLLQQ